MQLRPPPRRGTIAGGIHGPAGLDPSARLRRIEESSSGVAA